MEQKIFKDRQKILKLLDLRKFFEESSPSIRSGLQLRIKQLGEIVLRNFISIFIIYFSLWPVNADAQIINSVSVREADLISHFLSSVFATKFSFVVSLCFIGQLIVNILFSFTIIECFWGNSRNALSVKKNNLDTDRMNMFVRVLTHDLRNYLTIIKISAEKLERGDVSFNTVSAVGRKIVATVNRQQQVLDSIQQLVAIESGKEIMCLEAVELSQLISDVREVYEARLIEKNMTLVTGEFDKNIMVLADRDSLFHSVLCNLVSNAIKFSECGSSIHITCSESQSYVRLTIRDEGIGIPISLKGKIFSATEKTTRAGTAGEKGAGFGLPICKAYMDMYGGKIEFESSTCYESENHQGTVFTLSFKHALPPRITHLQGLLKQPEQNPID